MQCRDILIYIFLCLSLCIQGLNIVAAILAILTFNNFDSFYINPTSTFISQNLGTIVYIFIASGITSIALLVLIIAKCKNKIFQNVVYFFGYTILLMFQFGIGVVEAVALQNNSDFYINVSASKSMMSANGGKSSLITYLEQYQSTYKMMIAACVCTFVCVLLLFAIFYMKFQVGLKNESQLQKLEMTKSNSDKYLGNKVQG